MKNRIDADFARYATPALKAYDAMAVASYDAYSELAGSRPKKNVNRTCKNMTAAINKIAATRNIDEMIALEARLQNTDLEKYANSENDRKNVEQGLADLQCGIHSYNMLRNTPRQYEEFAKNFTDRNRDKRFDVPKDGMRYALSSQLTRLQNRKALQMSEEEKVLLTARRALVDAIVEEYSLLQKTAVHGDDKSDK